MHALSHGVAEAANLGANLIADRIDPATWRDELLPLVVELSDVMGLSSICGLGRSVPMPLRTVIDYFGKDLSSHLSQPQAGGKRRDGDH